MDERAKSWNGEKERSNRLKKVNKFHAIQEVRSLPSELRSCLMTSAFINSRRGKTFRLVSNLHTVKLTSEKIDNDVIKRTPDRERYLWWAVLGPRFLLICLELGGGGGGVYQR